MRWMSIGNDNIKNNWQQIKARVLACPCSMKRKYSVEWNCGNWHCASKLVTLAASAIQLIYRCLSQVDTREHIAATQHNTSILNYAFLSTSAIAQLNDIFFLWNVCGVCGVWRQNIPIITIHTNNLFIVRSHFFPVQFVRMHTRTTISQGKRSLRHRCRLYLRHQESICADVCYEPSSRGNVCVWRGNRLLIFPLRSVCRFATPCGFTLLTLSWRRGIIFRNTFHSLHAHTHTNKAFSPFFVCLYRMHLSIELNVHTWRAHTIRFENLLLEFRTCGFFFGRLLFDFIFKLIHIHWQD